MKPVTSRICSGLIRRAYSSLCLSVKANIAAKVSGFNKMSGECPTAVLCEIHKDFANAKGYMACSMCVAVLLCWNAF